MIEEYERLARLIASEWATPEHPKEDLQQECMIALWLKWDKVQAANKPSGYASRLMNRKCGDILRGDPTFGGPRRPYGKGSAHVDSLDYIRDEFGWEKPAQGAVEGREDPFGHLPEEVQEWLEERAERAAPLGSSARLFKRKFTNWDEMEMA